MQPLRRSAVAGTWYPGQPGALAAAVDQYVAAADLDPIDGQLRAVIAPHAGLIYSGPVASFAYKAVRDTRYGAIVLVGPSHFVGFKGVAIWPEGAWETPFGPVTVDSVLAQAIAAESPEIIADRAPHGREHSLEMQLPFIAHLLPGTPIVPLVMGYQTRATAEVLGDAIARAVAARSPAPAETQRRQRQSDEGHRDEATEPRAGEVLLVASSDLSHYEDAATAARLDTVVIQHVEALDPDGLMAALEREPGHACGGGPMVTVLRAARQLGARHARLLRYADSGDVSGDKSSVVGYMSAAIW